MSKITPRRNGIALLMLLLLVGSTTFTGWGKSLDALFAFDAHIAELTLGHDKTMSHPTDEFGSDDTIFAAVKVAGVEHAVKVKGRLHVVAIEGQKPGPIPGIETIVTLTREGTANFQFSKPTRGWPHGKYKFEALLINESGETIDKESHEFTVD